MIRFIGADHVIDYTGEDYTRIGKRFDRILDVAVERSIFEYKRALRPNGVFVAVGGSGGALFQFAVLGPLLARSEHRRMAILAWKPNKKEDLQFLKELFEEGKVKPLIDRCYPLSDAAEALRYLETGQALGKVVLTVAGGASATKTA